MTKKLPIVKHEGKKSIPAKKINSVVLEKIIDSAEKRRCSRIVVTDAVEPPPPPPNKTIHIKKD